MKFFLPVAILLWCSCSHSGITQVRFKNADPVLEVADKKRVPTRPTDNFPPSALYFYDAYLYNRVDRGLQFKGKTRALNTNAIDEVPNSTWFSNRIERRGLTPQEVYDGPNVVGSPQEHKPWTILSAKIGGASIGFVAQDSRGVKFILKFDVSAFPELETSADVITQRIIWAAGYNTAEDYILDFEEKQLILAEDAYEKDSQGKKNPLTKERLRSQLSRVSRTKTGSVRGLASMFLKGELLGGHSPEGTREGDLNDTIPHERRRELRGALPIFSWLDHVDVKDANAMDIYTESPDNPDHKYVVHYWLDFGKSLGVHAQIAKRKHFGYEYSYDMGATFKSLATLGFYSRPWENRATPTILGVGLIGSKTYDPEDWVAFFPAYVPFLNTDVADGFWGAKIAMSFTEEHIAAAVRSAHLSNPAATAYLTKVLNERKRITGAYWFSKVTPLDRFSVKGGKLCFTDLALKYQLATRQGRIVNARSYDYEGRENSWKWRATSIVGEQCTATLPKNSARDGYTIVKLQLSANNEERPAVSVHVARDTDGSMRPIGVWRDLL